VESSCKLGNEPSGSIKCWELPSCSTTCGLSSGTQLHIVRGVATTFYSILVLHSRGYKQWRRRKDKKQLKIAGERRVQ
jgi:hypothetical protein